MNKTYRTLLLIAMFLMGMPPLSSVALESKSPSEVQGVRQLWQVFQDDQARSEQIFLGKNVIIEGVVIDTGISIYLTPNVRLSDKPGGENYIVCVLPRGDADTLTSYKKDDSVIMTGRVYSSKAGGGRIVIKECQRVQ